MKLKSIEIAGFKSFARTVVLEFPTKVVAVVGPNGSGKSNVAEAIRWVLGEQSMKSLRGKRGEDLIFSGTPKAAAMGKASVSLSFDNADRSIPVAFDTVSIGRKIFRDGLNEYFINGSQVRLRDVVELMAAIGLGETKHNIIGQGEVDRILLASSRERRLMLEEALGLRVFQLKKKESLRKLEETEKNMKDVEALLREISPHLKYLKNLKERAEQREVFEKELRDLQVAYFSKILKDADRDLDRIRADDAPLAERLRHIEEHIVRLQKDVSGKEEVGKTFSAMRDLEAKLRDVDASRAQQERELGRLEGKIETEAERSQKPVERVVDMPFVVSEIKRIKESIERLAASPSARIDGALREIGRRLQELLDTVAKGTLTEPSEPSALLAELKEEKKKITEQATAIRAEAERLRSAIQKEEEGYRALQQTIRALDRELRVQEEERSDIRLERERTRLERERLEREKMRILADMEYARVLESDLSVAGGVFSTHSTDELRKKIEKTKLRLEEIGGVDASTLEEYRSTEERHQFLSKELSDLTQAKSDLYGFIRNLDETIERDFEEGFKKIQSEFQHYFKIIFGGGKAVLRHEILKKNPDDEEPDDEGEQREERGAKALGIDIEVDLPRKRIKSMAMLSGGERALTAIALLFAISAVNPPPFLVLDETDAALDEANSKLYADTLKELSRKTDLVIITHNRETMKRAGVLYGVTMGDDGISKLLSIQLEDARQYANR